MKQIVGCELILQFVSFSKMITTICCFTFQSDSYSLLFRFQNDYFMGFEPEYFRKFSVKWTIFLQGVNSISKLKCLQLLSLKYFIYEKGKESLEFSEVSTGTLCLSTAILSLSPERNRRNFTRS